MSWKVTRRQSRWAEVQTRDLPDRDPVWMNPHCERERPDCCAPSSSTTNVADRWGPLVDEDWHAVCQAIYRSVEGAESSLWE